MTRTDELTDRLINGTLTEAEAVELDSLLVADQAAQTRHCRAIRLELVLRGLRTEFNLAGATVAKIEADRVARTTAAVMAELRNRSTPARPASRKPVWAVFAILTAAVLIAVWLGSRPPEATRAPGDPPLSLPDFARLDSVSGSVEVVDRDGESIAHQDQVLSPTQTLRTVGEESVAVIAFPDRTRVEVHPESIVRFGQNGRDPAQRLVLVQGRITAVVSGSRLVVGAGGTEVETSRGSFSLWSAGAGSARVEPTDGDVRVSHGTPAEPVVLSPGRAVFVRNEQTPMRFDPWWQLDTEARSRLDFAALEVGFDDGGDVLAVSAKQWVRWKPGAVDPGRTLFLPKVFNDGLAARLTPDRRAVALCRVDDREERIVVRDLPSGVERGQVPVRVSGAQFLCVAPDASWIATVAPKPRNLQAHVWEVATGQRRFSFSVDHSISCLAASPDGQALAVGVADLGKGGGNLIAVVDPRTGQQLYELPTRRKAITALGFSEDGKCLAAGFNGAVQLWDVPGRKWLRTLEGFERVVTRLSYSPRGDLIAAGTQDGQVWVWSTTTGRRTQVIKTGTRGVRSLAFRPDGQFLVTATNKAPVAVWEITPEPANDSEPDA